MWSVNQNAEPFFNKSHLWSPRPIHRLGALDKRANSCALSLARPEPGPGGIDRRHEALEGVEALLEGAELRAAQALAGQQSFELAIVEPLLAERLLVEPHLAQDAQHRVHVQRPGVPAGRAHGHEVQHAFGVELGLVDAKVGHDDIRKAAVDFLVFANVRYKPGRRVVSCFVSFTSILALLVGAHNTLTFTCGFEDR